MLLLDLGNPGFFSSKVLFNRNLKNSMRALKQLAQFLKFYLMSILAIRCKRRQETVPVLIITLNNKTGLLLEFDLCKKVLAF